MSSKISGVPAASASIVQQSLVQLQELISARAEIVARQDAARAILSELCGDDTRWNLASRVTDGMPDDPAARLDAILNVLTADDPGATYWALTTARLHAIPAPDPTPCVSWCVLGHDDPNEAGDYHHGATVYSGPVSTCLDLDSTDTATVDLQLPGGAGEKLDLDEVDNLIARLTELRPVLAETLAERAALHTAGGAA